MQIAGQTLSVMLEKRTSSTFSNPSISQPSSAFAPYVKEQCRYEHPNVRRLDREAERCCSTVGLRTKAEIVRRAVTGKVIGTRCAP
jgi:hypothetical protein